MLKIAKRQLAILSKQTQKKMIHDFILHDFASLLQKIYISFFTWLIVLIAIGIDLYHGTRKSKSVGEYIHSYGLRKTVQKVINYMSMMLFMLLFDCLNPIVFIDAIQGLPIFSIIGAIVLTWIEFKSVREKADAKFRRKTEKATKEILDILTTDENVLAKVREQFKHNNNEQEVI